MKLDSAAQPRTDRWLRWAEAIAPEFEGIVGSVGAQAIAAFGLEVLWNMTSIPLYGEYEQADSEYAAPRFGHPKNRRPDLKRVHAGLAVTGDGGMPIFHRGYDGSAGEVAQLVPAMNFLHTMTRPRRFLLVGDANLISYGDLRDMIDTGCSSSRVRPASPGRRGRH
jgi:transposase